MFFSKPRISLDFIYNSFNCNSNKYMYVQKQNKNYEPSTETKLPTIKQIPLSKSSVLDKRLSVNRNAFKQLSLNNGIETPSILFNL